MSSNPIKDIILGGLVGLLFGLCVPIHNPHPQYVYHPIYNVKVEGFPETLACGTTYHFWAVAQDQLGSTSYSREYTFTTLECKEPTPNLGAYSPGTRKLDCYQSADGLRWCGE